MVSVREFQRHWLSKRCIRDGDKRQFVPEHVRQYIEPYNYTTEGFYFLKPLIAHLKRTKEYHHGWHSYDDLAFMLITSTPKTEDITHVFDKCNTYDIPMYEDGAEFEDLCSYSLQCHKPPRYYDGYDSDEDYGHNSTARQYAAQFIYRLYHKSQLLQSEKPRAFNVLRFIFTHEDVFNSRYMHHCYRIAS